MQCNHFNQCRRDRKYLCLLFFQALPPGWQLSLPVEQQKWVEKCLKTKSISLLSNLVQKNIMFKLKIRHLQVQHKSLAEPDLHCLNVSNRGCKFVPLPLDCLILFRITIGPSQCRHGALPSNRRLVRRCGAGPVSSLSFSRQPSFFSERASEPPTDRPTDRPTGREW